MNALDPSSAQPRFPPANLYVWGIASITLAGYLLMWWLHLRPGVFSFDSGFYLQQVMSGELNDQKPYFYARFLQLATLGGAFPQAASLVQAAVVSLLIGRCFAIAWWVRAHVAAVLVAALLVLNPYVSNFAFYVQNDGLYSIAILVLAVETLYIARTQNAAWHSLLVVALTAPMVLLFRKNGVMFLPLWALALTFILHVQLRRRLWLTAIAACSFGALTSVGVDMSRSQSALFPAVIHEVAGLARPGYQTDLGERLSPETRTLVGDEALEEAVAYYWPLYFDTIGFVPGGPEFINLSPDRQDAIIESFARNDLVPNVHSIAAHRLEMLLGAALAKAELANPYDAPTNLPDALGVEKRQRSTLVRGSGVFGKLNAWSIANRGWTWTALPGLLFLLGLLGWALWQHAKDIVWFTAALLLQAGAIAAFAPSAEYRYLLMIYLSPMLLLALPSGRSPARLRDPISEVQGDSAFLEVRT